MSILRSFNSEAIPGSVSYYKEYFSRFVIPYILVRTDGCFYCGYWSENCGCDARDF